LNSAVIETSLVVALAHKIVRAYWKVLTSEQVYEPYPART
jgi:hypothetical protein